MSHNDESGAESLFNKAPTEKMDKPIISDATTKINGNPQFEIKNVPESRIFINRQSKRRHKNLDTNLTGSDKSMINLSDRHIMTNEEMNKIFANVCGSQSQPKMETIPLGLMTETEKIRKQHLTETEHRQRLEAMRLEEERMHKEIETEAEFAQSEEGKELAKRRKLQEEKRHEEMRRRLQEEEEEREKLRIQKTLNQRQWLESINWKCSLETPQSSGRNFHNF